jgi:hypothetical protein
MHFFRGVEIDVVTVVWAPEKSLQKIVFSSNNIPFFPRSVHTLYTFTPRSDTLLCIMHCVCIVLSQFRAVKCCISCVRAIPRSRHLVGLTILDPTKPWDRGTLPRHISHDPASLSTHLGHSVCVVCIVCTRSGPVGRRVSSVSRCYRWCVCRRPRTRTQASFTALSTTPHQLQQQHHTHGVFNSQYDNSTTTWRPSPQSVRVR